MSLYIYSLSVEEKKSLNKLMEDTFGYIVGIEQSGAGHVSLQIGKPNQDRLENIADVGFGFSQVLPIVAQIHAAKERNKSITIFSDRAAQVKEKVFAVEQPELHLHPALQASLADLFVQAVGPSGEQKTQLKFLIETHSETIISRLGSLVAAGEISASNVAIYFVNKDENTDHSSITFAEYNEDGIIENWPLGFFSALPR